MVGYRLGVQVYLDHAATTPVRPEVVAAMAEVWADTPGNPTGSHAAARRARRRIDDARDVVAAFVGAEPGDVVFTSGGTEADNLAVHGAADPEQRVACSAVEHPAVLRPVELRGGVVVPVDAAGRLDLEVLAAVAAGGLGLLSVMLANNETGLVQDLAAIAAVLRGHAPSARLHTDAVQGAAWLPLPEALGGADLVSLSGHKLGGPMGVGALVLRDRRGIDPMLVGGGQERDRRDPGRRRHRRACHRHRPERGRPRPPGRGRPTPPRPSRRRHHRCAPRGGAHAGGPRCPSRRGAAGHRPPLHRRRRP
jgi:cysteine desulfurase